MGGCLGWNSISLSLSNKSQPNLVITCIFDCLIVLWNFMQKSPRIAEISTKVVGGLLFLCSPCRCTYPFVLNSTPLNLSLLPQSPFSCHPRRFTSPNSAPSLQELLQKNFFVSEGGSSEPNEPPTWICLWCVVVMTAGALKWISKCNRVCSDVHFFHFVGDER